jgi:hypothetical protein
MLGAIPEGFLVRTNLDGTEDEATALTVTATREDPCCKATFGVEGFGRVFGADVTLVAFPWKKDIAFETHPS